MKYSHSIVMIIPYMGTLPWYFPYFLHSCKYNKSIDFIILSDIKVLSENFPRNVRFIKYTIQQFKSEASTKLGFEVNINNGYKFCDFKPAYGFIFSELIKKYDFWGHCDVDLIFGNIRKFMTDNLLEEYDVISARHDYLTGSFALYRNIPFINNLFTHSKDYKKSLY